MAETNWYGNILVRAFEAVAAGKTWKIMLLADGHVVDYADDFIDDVSLNEIAAGSGYVAGGIALSGVTPSFVDGVFTLDANDWYPAGLSVSARYAVLYLDTGTPATSPVVSITDLTEVDGEEETITGLDVNTGGILSGNLEDLIS